MQRVKAKAWSNTWMLDCLTLGLRNPFIKETWDVVRVTVLKFRILQWVTVNFKCWPDDSSLNIQRFNFELSITYNYRNNDETAKYQLTAPMATIRSKWWMYTWTNTLKSRVSIFLHSGINVFGKGTSEKIKVQGKTTDIPHN